jgi:hypothetical protein
VGVEEGSGMSVFVAGGVDVEDGSEVSVFVAGAQ